MQRRARLLRSCLALVVGGTALAIPAGGCGGGGGDGGASGGGAPPVAYNYYVDAAVGNDANPGTEAAPFKTITTACATATSGQSVKVAPGYYDVANGETFPIVVPAGISLIGDESNKGDGAADIWITGSGTIGGFIIVIYPGSNSVIAGFAIANSASSDSAMGIVLYNNSGVTLRNNTILGNDNTGVRVDTSSVNHVIAGNVFKNNFIGLSFVDGGAGSRVEGNRITNNNTGVVYYSPSGTEGGDLGGGAAGSAGGNWIWGNETNDLFTATAGTIYAKNCYWDHTPPTIGTDSTVDIYNSSVATIHTDESKQVSASWTQSQ